MMGYLFLSCLPPRCSPQLRRIDLPPSNARILYSFCLFKPSHWSHASPSAFSSHSVTLPLTLTRRSAVGGRRLPLWRHCVRGGHSLSWSLKNLQRDRQVCSIKYLSDV
ncbi:hypothetical protein F2P81_018469 [Scophthalmus maximus]|uniref:Uncharacterized protein n=1 Tax=Scophthalmus maximus TaxID=52904 RepID=A0A6A4SER0_SCOMX|nr:hypothetical protein F2P81_018469 [Scophthalmus maximus]